MRGEELLQPFDIASAFGGAPPAVLAVHVKDEGGGDPSLEDAYEQQAGEEGLACAALAEDAVAAHHQLLQVQDDLGLHVQGCADGEMPLVLPPEDRLYIGFGSLLDG